MALSLSKDSADAMLASVTFMAASTALTEAPSVSPGRPTTQQHNTMVCHLPTRTQVTEAAAETATSQHYYCDYGKTTASLLAADSVNARPQPPAGALGLSQALGLCSRPAFGRQGQTKPDFF